MTEGEGNGKKSSKTEAALLMIEKLKDLPPVASCQKVPKKKSTSAAAAAAAKKKSKNLIKLEQKANPDYGQSINPISRLIQIQQAKKQKEPVYTLIAERGMPRRREFVMEVRLFFFRKKYLDQIEKNIFEKNWGKIEKTWRQILEENSE